MAVVMGVLVLVSEHPAGQQRLWRGRAHRDGVGGDQLRGADADLRGALAAD